MCTHTCTDTHMQCMHTHTQVCVHTYMYTHRHIHVHTCTHMYMHAHTCAHENVHTHVFIHTSAQVHTYVYAHMYTHMYTRAHSCMYTHTCIHIHTALLSAPLQLYSQHSPLKALLTILSSDTKLDFWFKVHSMEGKDRRLENISHSSFIIGPPELWVAGTNYACLLACLLVLHSCTIWAVRIFCSPLRSSKDMKVALKISQEYWTWKWNSSAELVTTDTLNSLFQIETSKIWSFFSLGICIKEGGESINMITAEIPEFILNNMRQRLRPFTSSKMKGKKLQKSISHQLLIFLTQSSISLAINPSVLWDQQNRRFSHNPKGEYIWYVFLYCLNSAIFTAFLMLLSKCLMPVDSHSCC